MPFPDTLDLSLQLLRLLGDGQKCEIHELRDKLAAESKLTNAERSKRCDGQPEPHFNNAVSSAVNFLSRQGHLLFARPGCCCITDFGRHVLSENPSRVPHESGEDMVADADRVAAEYALLFDTQGNPLNDAARRLVEEGPTDPDEW